MPKQVMNIPVEHVSDTAYMVALLRALESERADAQFRDPYASILAAPKADDLTKRLPFVQQGQWMMTIRTCLIDEQIKRLVSEEGVDSVINMAAGLDTRPYRLGLASSVQWCEVDFPAMINYKSAKLSAIAPSCQLQRVPLDLCDDKARHELISALAKKAKKILVLTEGLLYYLPESTVTSLAHDLSDEKKVAYWMMDTITEEMMAWMQDYLGSEKKEEQESKVKISSFRLEAKEFFGSLGWKIENFSSFAEGSRRFGRSPHG